MRARRQPVLGQRLDDGDARRGTARPWDCSRYSATRPPSCAPRKCSRGAAASCGRRSQETERARKDAEAAGRAKDQLFAVLSHELRTPLTPVMFGTEMLLLRDDIPRTSARRSSMIQRNVALEARLVDDLLDVTRIRHGKVELMFPAMDAARRGRARRSRSPSPTSTRASSSLIVALDAARTIA